MKTLPDPLSGENRNEVPDTVELEQQIANAIADFTDLQSRGEAIDIDAFCRLHPDLSPYLESELRAETLMDQIFEAETWPHDDSFAKDDLPEKLSGLKILSEIRSGGMGRVLLAIDERLGRKVAIKTLKSRYLNNTVLRERFMQEARSLAKLNHPNIVSIFNLGQSEEIPHFVMEYIEGVSLTDAAQPLTLNQKVTLMHKAVLAVEFLHQHHLIHRDLKPGNILVGSNLEPILLDFGLARQLETEANRLTRAGEVAGTPDYFSPEQARGDSSLDARSDIFSLGAIFYQLLTGVVPFRADSLSDQIQKIKEDDPILPRRHNHALPGDLQNICLKALEKNPGDRYATAREMAEDLARFLAGETVLANPSSYARMMSGKIAQHLRELTAWRQDKILSEFEFGSFQKLYNRLIEREDAWILEVRRLSLAQVSLYLGGWILIVGASLLFLFRYQSLVGTPAVIFVVAAAIPTLYIGIRCWQRELLRIGVAYLLAFCLLLPVALLVATGEWKFFSGFTHGKEDLEFFAKIDWSKRTTNAQMWWSLFLSLPAYLWLRRFTRSTVFSLVFASATALLSIVTLLRMGLLDWLDNDPGKAYLNLIPFAVGFFVVGLVLERLRCADDSRYFYPIAVFFTFVSLSGVAAFHQPYADWLKSVAPRTRGQIEYLFIINAAIYLIIQTVSERFGTPQVRQAAKWFRFVIPGHVMVSLLILGIEASGLWNGSPDDIALKHETRFFEIALPVVALFFIFGSIPKQMKNYFASGILFLAIGIVRLQGDIFRDRAAWPISLLCLGLLLMILAANYTPIKLKLSNLPFRKK